MDNPYSVVGAPNYSAPIINWFGTHPENVGQRTPQQIQQQSNPPPAGSQPGPTFWARHLSDGLRQFLGLADPNANPARGGMGLPTAPNANTYGPNVTGSLY